MEYVLGGLVAGTEPSVVHVGLSQQTNEPANGWNYPPPHCLLSTDCSPQCAKPQYDPCFHQKSLNPCQEFAKAIFLPTVEPLKVSSEYCHLSSFSTQNLQLSQRSEYCPILRRFCKTGCSLSMTCIPPLSSLSPPPSQIGAKCHISTHQTCHTMCHVKDATLADNIYFAGAGSQNAC